MNKFKILENMIRTEVKKQLNEDWSEATEVYNSIDWDAVGREILKTFKIKTQLTFKQNQNRVEMRSSDFINQCGVFKYAIGRCELTFFSNRLVTDPNMDEKFWASINLTYPGNGMTIGSLSVTQDDRIIVEANTPRTTT